MITVEFSKQELDILVGLLDLAVKAGGLSVAQNALILTSKIQNAYGASEQPKPEPSKVSKDEGAGKKPV